MYITCMQDSSLSFYYPPWTALDLHVQVYLDVYTLVQSCYHVTEHCDKDVVHIHNSTTYMYIGKYMLLCFTAVSAPSPLPETCGMLLRFPQNCSWLRGNTTSLYVCHWFVLGWGECVGLP